MQIYFDFNCKFSNGSTNINSKLKFIVIISRTPYRISFFGGGTDYHTWYQENGGQVLSTTINKYCYITARFLPPFFTHKSRIVWSKIEEVNDNNSIYHPSVRETLKFLNMEENGVEVHHNGDLPARSGLGSSSSFTIGLLNALYGMCGYMPSKMQLASEAIYIERELIRENVGVQDQIAASFGGLNKITIGESGAYSVQNIIISQKRYEEFNSHLMLFFTGISRTASEIAAEKIKSIPNKKVELLEMYKMVDTAINILASNQDINDFGRMLHETWMLKRSLSNSVSNSIIDDIYNLAMQNGAKGGKLLGAGGGGFMLIFASPEDHSRIKKALHTLLEIPFKFENGGSSIIFCDRTDDSADQAWKNREFIHLRKSEQELLSFLKVGSYE